MPEYGLQQLMLQLHGTLQKQLKFIMLRVGVIKYHREFRWCDPKESTEINGNFHLNEFSFSRKISKLSEMIIFLIFIFFGKVSFRILFIKIQQNNFVSSILALNDVLI